MARKDLDIPDGIGKSNMHKHDDQLYIKVKKDCTWCYSDPSGCFPSLLPTGPYTATNPPTVYGPYTPETEGVVNYNAVTSGTCDPNAERALAAAAHSITVTSVTHPK
jgi:hypothetical protein